MASPVYSIIHIVTTLGVVDGFFWLHGAKVAVNDTAQVPRNAKVVVSR